MNPSEAGAAVVLHRLPSFHLSAALTETMPPGAQSDKTMLSDYCWLAVVRGQGTIAINSKLHPLYAGVCLMMRPGSVVRTEAASAEALLLYRLHFIVDDPGGRGANGSGAAEELLGLGEVRFQQLHLLAEFMEELAAGAAQTDPLGTFRANIRFQELLADLFEQNRPGDSEQTAIRTVEQTIVVMHRSFREVLSIDQLARDAGVGRAKYNSLFKSITGSTPIDYLTQLRINRAKTLLQQPGSRLKDVAAEAGFQDEYYFSRRFKMTVGMSPKRYANRYARQPRIVSLQYLGELLSLGVKPVGTNESLLHAFPAEAKGVAGIGEPFDADFVLRLKPDLILLPSFLPKDWHETIAKLAPVAEIDWFDDVYARMNKIGALLDRRKEAEAWIGRYEAKSERTREFIAPYVSPGESATAFIYDGKHRKLFIYGRYNFGHTLYRALRFAPPDKLRKLMERDKRLRWTHIEPEAMQEYAGDRVFLLVTEDDAAQKWARAMLGSTAWTRLPAVRNGRAYVVPCKWGLYDPLTLDHHLDEMAELLTNSAGGW
ncbi:helix-turn-helix domain-containing protein [Paenibacillus ginsengarvi]|nr:helix-turn-helix domain-containing protein [Paenibacillus ginsengarvi]